MTNLVRYDFFDQWGEPLIPSIDAAGAYMRYEDIKHLLQDEPLSAPVSHETEPHDIMQRYKAERTTLGQAIAEIRRYGEACARGGGKPAREPDAKFNGLLTDFGVAQSKWARGEGTREAAAAAHEAVYQHVKSALRPTEAKRVCPDSEDGDHVLKQDGPFSVVYCDACGMNRGYRTQERPEPKDDPLAEVRWICECTTVNAIDWVKCSACRLDRPVVNREAKP